MSGYEIDHAAIRARVEQRLKPRMKLIRRRNWLFAQIALFVAVFFSIYGSLSTKPLFFYSETFTQPSSSFTDSITNQVVVIPEQTFTTWYPYPLVPTVLTLWFALIVVQALTLLMAFGRERMIQREINREMELEKMRLQVELACGYDEEADELEKPKRAMSLTDDGELNYDATSTPRRNTNHS